LAIANGFSPPKKPTLVHGSSEREKWCVTVLPLFAQALVEMLALAFGECHGADILRTYATDLAAAVGKWLGNAKQTANITPLRARP
jgi:hypothetical protein